MRQVRPRYAVRPSTPSQELTIPPRSTKFSTFPELFLFQARRFQLIGWVPQKVDVPLVIGDTLSMDRFQGKGLQTGEVQLPDSTTEEAPQGTVWNVESMQALTGMGFPEVRCQRALSATGNGGADEAMNWLFAHMEDPGTFSSTRVTS